MAPGDAVMLPVHDALHEKGLLQGVEVFNGNDIYTNAWPWANRLGLTLFANSDSHVPVDPPQPRHENHRTMTFVFARERSAEGIREALRAGRTAVWYKTLVAGRREWVEPLVRASIAVDPPHHADRKNTWASMRNLSDFSFTLRRTGGPGPDRIELPAGKTVLLKLPVARGAAADLAYAAENVLTAPGQNLPLTWLVRAP